MTTQLFPRQPRQMRQPRKDQLREAVVALTEENIRLRAEVDKLRRPWWRRLMKRSKAA